MTRRPGLIIVRNLDRDDGVGVVGGAVAGPRVDGATAPAVLADGDAGEDGRVVGLAVPLDVVGVVDVAGVGVAGEVGPAVEGVGAVPARRGEAEVGAAGDVGARRAAVGGRRAEQLRAVVGRQHEPRRVPVLVARGAPDGREVAARVDEVEVVGREDSRAQAREGDGYAGFEKHSDGGLVVVVVVVVVVLLSNWVCLDE